MIEKMSWFPLKNAFKSAVARVRVRPAKKGQHARTSHAQLHQGLAPIRTLLSRTHRCDRTHARTHVNALSTSTTQEPVGVL